MTKKELAQLTAETQRMLSKNERMGYIVFLKGLKASTSNITKDIDPYILLASLNQYVDSQDILKAYQEFAIRSSKSLIPQNLKLMIKGIEGKFNKNEVIQQINVGFRNEEIIKQVYDVSNNLIIADKVTRVTEYTQELIAKTIRDGLAQNKTKAQIARDITKITNGEVAKMRAIRIARTETTYINSEATKILSDAIPFRQEKRWLPRLDGRERESHGAMQGKKPIPKEELFIVGDSRMRYPGDSSNGASAGEVVNCRCAVHYSPIEEEYEDTIIESNKKANLIGFLKSLLVGMLSSTFFR